MAETRGLKIYTRDALESPRLQTQPRQEEDPSEKLKRVRENRKRRLADKLEDKDAELELKELQDELEGGNKDQGNQGNQGAGNQPTTGNQKRYRVDPESGDMWPTDSEDGLSYGDALLAASQIKAKGGKFSEAQELFNTFKSFYDTLNPPESNKGKEEPERAWDVDDEGRMYRDPEGGEYTYREAKAVSESRRKALVPKDSDDKLTAKDLELERQRQENRVKELKDEFYDAVNKTLEDYSSRIPQPKGLFDQIMDLVQRYQSLPEPIRKRFDALLGGGDSRDSSLLLRDSNGNPVSIEDWIKLERFRRSEDRADRRERTLNNFFEEGRKQLPSIVEGFKEMFGGGGRESAFTGTEWENLGTEEPQQPAGEKQTAREAGNLATVKCAGCGQDFETSSNVRIAECDYCGTLNFRGSQQEFEWLKDQINATAGVTSETQQQETEQEAEQTESETGGGELIEQPQQ